MPLGSRRHKLLACGSVLCKRIKLMISRLLFVVRQQSGHATHNIGLSLNWDENTSVCVLPLQALKRVTCNPPLAAETGGLETNSVNAKLSRVMRLCIDVHLVLREACAANTRFQW